MPTLQGKVAIISGSSGGIGAAIARELSHRGARVVINYPFTSEKEKADAVLSTLEGPAGSITVEADLSSATGPSKLVEAAVERFGTIDILVNNAGISAPLDIRHADLDECLSAWDSMAVLNGRGTLLLTRAVLKHLAKQNSRIINICSTTSRNPEPAISLYAGTKGMIESFTRCWARDLPREYGCTVNTVAPGPVATEHVLSAPAHILEILRRTSEGTPVAPRMAYPSEVAWIVATLCDKQAGWLNGLYIPVAGGSTLS
ncbi:3-oxoacyl-(acyl-carrier) reductase [Fusarium agapanthi]|uniref:3-oxoacyl-(Acyl-carrier) reductase n=1 Tax=Fusarium agapanthi TaxID=1803897 RepID=A0A9P5AW97_9HYPO|nr:3-oxoacyl-(acyl-carrier) reductase [Fusarium agapanthi]